MKFESAVCPHDCPSVCALSVEVSDDGSTLGRVRGSKANPFTAGVVCAKVARYAERHHHSDRLTKALRRVRPGWSRDAFEPIAVEAALDEVAEQFTQRGQRFGPETVWPYYFAGTMGLVAREGINRLRHAAGYSGQDANICTMLPNLGWQAGVGQRRGVDAMEIASDSDVVVVWGTNPVNTHVNLVTHIAQAKKRGAKLVVVDVYETGTAKQADLFVAVKPSTDGALAAALGHCWLRDGRCDEGFLDTLSDFDGGVAAHYATCTPAWASEICGVPAEQIEALAQVLASSKAVFYRVGYGFSRARNGAASLHAVTCLPTLMGNWRVRGGGALYSQSGRYGLDLSGIDGSDMKDPATRVLDMCRLGPILNGARQTVGDLGQGPEVTALLIQNTNPLAVNPDLNAVHRGFARDDLFVCTHEQFFTETAAASDIVLPATMFLEHDDVYIGSAHSRLAISPKRMETLGDCMSNHDVICGLANRLGLTQPSFMATAAELIEQALARSGYPDFEALVASEGIERTASFEEEHFLNGFPNKTGRFCFKPDWLALGAGGAELSSLPGYQPIEDRATEALPFRLVAAPARNFLNSSFTETSTSQAREERPTALVLRQTADRLGLTEGTVVILSNDLGSVRLHLSLVDGGQDPQTVVVESIWPNASYLDGLGINALISADRGRPNGGGVFHDTAVALHPAAVCSTD